MLALGALAAAILTAGTTPGKTWFVDADVSPGGDGFSWATAFDDLQDALDSVLATDTIWVAAGTYRPDRATGDRSASFEIRNRVSVFGGFAGSETSLEQRDVTANVTTLTGDLNGDDGPDFANNADNSYNVVRVHMLAGVGDVRLDGFTITGVNADVPGSTYFGALYYETEGEAHFLSVANCRFVANNSRRTAGAFLKRGTADFTDCLFQGNVAFDDNGGAILRDTTPLTLTRCDFIENQASGHGGAVWANSAPITMTGCNFVGNFAAFSGGAVYALGTMKATDCTFESNQTAPENQHGFGFGGGLYLDGVADFLRCRFLSNTARRAGGGVHMDVNFSQLVMCEFRGNVSLIDSGGGLSFHGGDGDQLVNCLFVGNTAAGLGGGACFCSGGGGPGRLLFNCVFAGNSGGTAGGVYAADGDDFIHNCIFWDNTDDGGSGEGSQLFLLGAIEYSCVQGWTGGLGGAGNHGLDPLFVDLDGADGVIGNEDDDLRLISGSPCIDAADNTAVPADALDVDGDGDVLEQVPLDLAGNPRFADDPGTADTGMPGGGNPIVDMGPYEYRCPWDLDGSGDVGINDFLDLLAQWGTDPGGPPDFDGDGDVGITDFLELLANWGLCT